MRRIMTKSDFARSPTKSAKKISKETSEYMKKMSGEVEVIFTSKPVSHSKCKKCGLPIAWGKSKNGKPMPVNIDGSEHWDACSEAKTKLAIANGKVYLPESSGWITGSEYVEAECSCIPWEGCEVCCKETLPDEQQSHLNSI